MSWLSSKTQRKLGIDLSSQAIKFIELSKKDQTYSIENYGTHAFAQPVITSGMIDEQEKVSEAISKLLKQKKCAAKHAMFAVPDACTLRKVIAASPHLSSSDLEELATMEVEKLWPHATQTLYFDFQWCSSVYKDASLHELLIIASRSDYIEQRTHIAKRSGLRIAAMDVESQALYRMYALTSPGDPNLKTIGWLHIEKTWFDLYIFDKDVTVFTHREIFKNHPVVNEQDVVVQIERVIQMFQASYPMYDNLHQIILSEMNTTCNWSVLLSKALAWPIVKINPWDKLPLAKHLDAHLFLQQRDSLLIACGLALRT